jgi:hypothetical protein
MAEETLQLETYGLESGFISNLPPLRHLDADYYSSWESLMSKFHDLLRARQLRGAVLKVRSQSPKKYITVSFRLYQRPISKPLHRRDEHTLSSHSSHMDTYGAHRHQLTYNSRGIYLY